MKKYLFIPLITVVGMKTTVVCASTVFVVFSYNRPMQLFALLESSKKYITGITATYVLYRADNQRFQDAYQCVKKHFCDRTYFIQQQNPPSDFQSTVNSIIAQSRENYLLFGVDDIIVTNFINLSTCIFYLEQTHAYGFYLRLGKNITTYYHQQKEPAIPEITDISQEVSLWALTNSFANWNYPHTVDMTLYNKEQITKTWSNLVFHDPNSFEGAWCGVQISSTAQGLCFHHSKIVNIPLNRVNTTCQNDHMNLYTPEQLLGFFEQGYKIDIQPFFDMHNNSPHMDHEVRLVPRK